MTLAQMIAAHNALAARLEDVAAIEKFSASKAKLQERIDALQARVDALPASDDCFRLADLARDLHRNAKVLRAKHRRLLASGDHDLPAMIAPNVYANADRDRVIAALS